MKVTFIDMALLFFFSWVRDDLIKKTKFKSNPPKKLPTEMKPIDRGS